MSKRSLYLVLLLLLAVFLQACASPAVAPAAATQPAEAAQPAGQTPADVVPDTGASEAGAALKLKVAVQPFITFVPYHIALKEGYFAEQGLDVELINFNTTQQILPALSSGQVDIASGLVTAGLFNAIARGGEFRIVSDKGYIQAGACSNWGLTVQKDFVDEVKTAADLKGRTVNVVPASWLEYYLARLLATAGLTTKDIAATDLGTMGQPEAFDKGAIQIGLNSEPWLTRFTKSGHLQTLTPAEELMPDSTGAVMFYGPTVLGNPEAGQKFMVAYLKAVRQLNEGKTGRNLALIAEFTQLDAALLQEMCWPAMRPDGAVNLDDLAAFQEWAKSAGYLETTVAPEQYWDGSFVDFANQELGQP